MRPRIICHMVTSIDGRLLTGRLERPGGACAPDALAWSRYAQAEARLVHDGRIAGRRAFEHHAAGFSRHQLVAPAARQEILGDRAGRRLAIVFDPSGRLRFAAGARAEHLVVALSTRVPDSHLAHLETIGASCLFAGPEGRDIGAALVRLRAVFGVECLLLEGGGRLNGAFLAAGLIDETSTLVLPAIDGLSGVPAIYDHVAPAGSRPAAGQPMRLLSVETLEGGIVWLRHGFIRP